MIRIFFSLLCLFAATGAQADIYGFIDAQGVIHFADHKVDSRYILFAKTGEKFDSAKMAQSAATDSVQGSGEMAESDALADAGQHDIRREMQRAPPAPVSAERSRFFQRVSDHPNVGKFAPLIKQVARESGVDLHLIQSVIAVESGYNPTAVSPKGAVGLMQIMPATGERYGARADGKRSVEQKLTDPAINLRIGARYLADLRKMFNDDLSLVLAAYNAGENAVKRYRNTIPPFRETQAYVKLVGEFYHFYQPVRPTQVARPVRAATPPVAQQELPAATRVRMTIGSGRRNMPDMGRLAPAEVLKMPSSSPDVVADGAYALNPHLRSPGVEIPPGFMRPGF